MAEVILSWHVSMHNRAANFLRNTFQDRFKRYLIISLVILGIIIGFTSQGPTDTGEGYEVHFFYVTGCSHCDDQRSFNERLADAYPSIQILEHDVATPQGRTLLDQMLEERGIEYEPSFPITIFGNQVFGDWESEETTGSRIEEALQQCLAGDCPAPPGEQPRDTIVLPWFGEIVLADYSLPALAVVLGIVDGFNPCAMWVLVYLISIVATLRDRRRIWLIVGSFVLASGILYFLFMTVWLNLFLFIGYVKPVTVVIGLVALGGGALQIREVIATKGAVVCAVTDEESDRRRISEEDHDQSTADCLISFNVGDPGRNHSAGFHGEYGRVCVFSRRSGSLHQGFVIGWPDDVPVLLLHPAVCRLLHARRPSYLRHGRFRCHFKPRRPIF
jgi:hypothetical protein